MKKIYSVFVLLLAVFSVKASHISYTDITYKNLGGNTYEFTLTLYRDCGGAPAPTTISLPYCSPSACGSSGSVTLLPVSGTGLPIFPVCSYPSSVCTGGTDEGFEKYVYKGTYTLPSACSDWTFMYGECCRETIITTISAPLATGTGIIFKIDNLNYPGNSSPTFNDEPVMFACCNESFSYNQSATDIDGDSLVYSLYHPYSDVMTCTTNTPVTYTGTYSAVAPLTSLPLMNMDPATGYLTMYPTNCSERGVIGVKVDEYRAGSLIGSILRDNMVIVTNEIALGQHELKEQAEVSVYPNPFDAIISLNINKAGGNLSMYNALGELVYSQKIIKTTTDINLEMLPKGIYLIRIKTISSGGSDILTTKKIIKE